MARKKKKAVTEQKNPIVYSGNVTVTMKKKNTIISRRTTHNNGTNNLFRALCMCLCGDEDGISLMPYFIDAGRMNGDVFDSYLTSPTIISRHTTIYDSTSSIWKAQFVSTILYSQMESASVQITALALLNSSQETLAIISLSEDEAITIESNAYTAMIEWDMSFSNPTSTQ